MHSCDKGPVLEQLLDSVGELKLDQKRMIDALVDLAKHQERLVILADRTTENKTDIDLLFKSQREIETQFANRLQDLDSRFVAHIIKHPTPESCKSSKILGQSYEGKFDKIQVAVILTMIYFLSNQVWSILQSLVQAVQRTTGAQ